MDCLVVGCGLNGAVIVCELAEKGTQVELWKCRNHIGGNMLVAILLETECIGIYGIVERENHVDASMIAIRNWCTRAYGRIFGVRGCYVSTIGNVNEATVKKYIRSQEENDKLEDSR